MLEKHISQGKVREFIFELEFVIITLLSCLLLLTIALKSSDSQRPGWVLIDDNDFIVMMMIAVQLMKTWKVRGKCWKSI